MIVYQAHRIFISERDGNVYISLFHAQADPPEEIWLEFEADPANARYLATQILKKADKACTTKTPLT